MIYMKYRGWFPQARFRTFTINMYFFKVDYLCVRKCYNISDTKSNDGFRKGTCNDYIRKHHFYDKDSARS